MEGGGKRREKHMRAAVCTRFGEPFEIRHLDLTPPGRNEVHVRIMACAICHSDITYADGGWGGEAPLVLGHEASGEVISVGDGVDDLAPGDRLVVTLIRSCGTCPCCSRGYHATCETHARDMDTHLSYQGKPVGQGLKTAAFAEETVVHRSQVVKISNDLPWDVAALLACGVITGYGAVENTAAMPEGATVAVIGCGGVGLNAVQAARIGAAARIIAVDVSPRRCQAAMTFGATEFVNALERDAIRYVRSATGGRGADFVFVTVGSEDAINTSFRMCAPGGASVLVGMPHNEARARFSPVALSAASQRILGSVMGHTDPQIGIPALIARYDAGELKLDELISSHFTLDGINEAMDATRAGSGLRNVVMIGAAL